MASSPVKKLFSRSAIISVIVISVVLGFALLGVFDRAENMLYDSRMLHTAGLIPPSDEIVVVLVDQNSIDWGAKEFEWGWPWQRKIYGDIVNYFALGNAASVTFDVLFSEPSVYGTEDDALFAAACKNYGHVAHIVHLDTAQTSHIGWHPSAPLPPYDDGSEPCTQPLIFPVEPIVSSAAVIGAATSSGDIDGTIRSAKAFHAFPPYHVPSLGVASLFAAGQDVPTLETEPADGRLLRFQPSLESYVPYSAAQILQSYYAIQQGKEPLLDPTIFEGMYVFFGFYAPGLFDICTTPISTVYPGVGVHITQLDNYLSDAYLEKVPNYVYLLLVILCTFLGVVPITATEIVKSKKISILATVIFSLLCCIVYFILSYLIFANGIVIPMVAPLAALIVGFVLAVLISYRQEGRQKRYLKSAFKQYLSPVVIEDLITNPERLTLGGEKRHISIYFSDIQGFTSISEKLAPEELTSLLNDYLSAMTDIILEHGGTIDKYEGDAIIAFWNAPVEQKNHARLALEAAVACQEKLAQMRPELQIRAGMPFYMRIGLNTGDAVVGNMGSRSRFDYTMLGDSVNLAARLEGLNKQFGTFCMCSETTKKEAEAAGTNLKFRELARAAIVGKKEAVTVYEPMSAFEYEKRKETLKAFETALQLFYAGNFKQAEILFSALQSKDDTAIKYKQKCLEFIANPPDMANWQGVWQATSK